MSDDQRVYSDEEFAVILGKAAELASRPQAATSSSAGLTLPEMKAAAAQVGFDPALVERAARMLSATTTVSPLERLIGGPLRHGLNARFSVRLDEERAAQLLSAVRISAGLPGSRDVGHFSSMGMSWHDGAELESLGITARPEKDGTTVSVTLDRRGTFGVVVVASGVVMFLSVLFSAAALYPEAPALGVAGLVASVGGTLAIARSYWASSTRKVRERISGVMDVIGQALSQPETGDSGRARIPD
jgi:hypothetical protein